MLLTACSTGGQEHVPVSTPSTSASTRAVETPEATPEATPDPYPADPAVYDVASLPPVGVYDVVPELPVDTAPADPVQPVLASSAGPAAPVFAAPGTAPVAQLLAEHPYGGTSLPVVEQHESWLKVLLPGRAGLPSAGVVGQLTGWVRVADVTTTPITQAVHVNLATGELTITDSGAPTYSTTGFGYGKDATPTPLGRTFIMTVFTDPSATYTRGHPTVALGSQSPTLDGFAGADIAVTAFHYHDTRSGAVSNGCLRVDEATIAQLAALPLGTPVTVTA